MSASCCWTWTCGTLWYLDPAPLMANPGCPICQLCNPPNHRIPTGPLGPGNMATALLRGPPPYGLWGPLGPSLLGRWGLLLPPAPLLPLMVGPLGSPYFSPFGRPPSFCYLVWVPYIALEVCDDRLFGGGARDRGLPSLDIGEVLRVSSIAVPIILGCPSVLVLVGYHKEASLDL